MKEKQVNIKKIKQELFYHHVYYTLDDLYSNYRYQDKKFNEMLYDLLAYVERLISPPDNSGDIVDKYVVVEYEADISG